MDLAAGDSVSILDGDGLADKTLARYTLDGQEGPLYVTTTGPKALILMTSRSMNPSSRGFKLSYRVGE